MSSYLENKIKKILKPSGITLNGKKPWDIQVNDPTAFRDVIIKGSLGFGDSYVSEKWDVDQIDTMFEKLLLSDTKQAFNIVDILQSAQSAIINTQAGKRAFQVGHNHYDIGNSMYEYMLGESMGYSCGMFVKESDSLTTAQYNKFDMLCKKLKLKPGMKVLEIGAGWGTFARHASKKYGVEVVGLTVSKEQKAFAEERCKGLPVKFLLVDYQKLSKKYTDYFDRVVSIEMIEAVGKKNFKKYFEIIERSLKADGLFGLQAIIGTGEVDSFISTRIFPNGRLPSPQDIVNKSKNLLQIKQWESFGTDYDKTLLAWEANFRRNWNKISKLTNKSGEVLYDVKFYRMWRYYLLCCAATFRIGFNDVAQIIMSKHKSVTVLK